VLIIRTISILKLKLWESIPKKYKNIKINKMSKLINELKQEHETFINTLNELKKVSVTSTKGIEIISQFKIAILSHLAKEDRLLYPPLYEKAKSNLSLKKALDTFATNMDEITEYSNNFYEKYTNNNIDKTEFLNDITKFIILFKERVMKEEVIIFKAYEKFQIN